MPFTPFSFKSRGRAGRLLEFYPYTRKRRSGPVPREGGPGGGCRSRSAGRIRGAGRRDRDLGEIREPTAGSGEAPGRAEEGRGRGEGPALLRHLPPLISILSPLPPAARGNERGLAAGVPPPFAAAQLRATPCPSFTPVPRVERQQKSSSRQSCPQAALLPTDG